ncbi:MAG: hypothetical protein IGS03_09265 [Candidatus Sericytochromatia bacterium]|nr:hypothetical protein [Candidatus Sericytochromatia bacterium]
MMLARVMDWLLDRSPVQKTVYIHYEVHQHLHLSPPNAYQQVLNDALQTLQVPLRSTGPLPAPVQSRRVVQVEPR